MARAQGARAQMALAFEIHLRHRAGRRRVLADALRPCNLGSEQTLLASELLGYGRDPVAPIGDAINVDGDITVPIDARFFGVWLKAIFGAPTTTGPPPASTPTSSARAAGRCRAWRSRSACPTCRIFGINAGCVANQLSWTMQRSGLITATVDLIAPGRDDRRRAASPAR